MKKRKQFVFLRLIGFMGKSLPKYFIGLVGLAILAFLFLLTSSLALKNLFNAINPPSMDLFILGMKLLLLNVILSTLGTTLFQYMVDSSVARGTGNLRQQIFHHAHNLPVKFFRRQHSGDLISRLTNDIAEAEKSYAQTFTNFFSNVFAGIGSAIVMFYMDWRLALFSISMGIIMVLVNSFYAKILRRLSRRVQERVARVTEKLSDLLAGMDVIRSFNLGRFILNKFRSSNQEVYQSSYQRVGKEASLGVLNSLFGSLNFVGLVGLGCYLVIQGEINLGIVLGITQMQNGVHQMIQTLTTFITEIQASLAAGERLFDVLDEELEPTTYQLESSNANQKGAIDFVNVDFEYKANEKVLNQLSFSAKAGQVVALAGPSGGGKSTIMKLVLGFYQPQHGDIVVHGSSMGEQTLKDIRSQLAYVPQNAFLFAGTIAENIGYGRENATKEEIIDAAKQANAHGFIMELKKDYDTLVGERGAHLSGGQRQRIAIARAILKDAPILLLDEATSALDNESEYLVQQALAKLMVGRTTLVIAHRLSTIQSADKILVIKDGTVVESGTHHELLQINDGVYQNLYDQQFVQKDAAIA